MVKPRALARSDAKQATPLPAVVCRAARGGGGLAGGRCHARGSDRCDSRSAAVFLLSPAAREREQRAEVGPMREQHKSEGPMKPRAKFVTAALLLIGGASTASAQSYWYNGDYALKQRGYYGTPYDGGPQYGSGGGDQYGYGPAYSYGKQAPAPPPCVWRRVWNGHYWVRSCV
jgi:hypothetical protein